MTDKQTLIETFGLAKGDRAFHFGEFSHVKVELWDNRVRVGWNLKQSQIDLDHLYELLAPEFGDLGLYRRPNLVEILTADPLSIFANVVKIIQDQFVPQGALFTGTILERCKERGASILAFRERCNLKEKIGAENMYGLAEVYVSAGEIDAVFYDYDEDQPRAIVEVQSGIHLGTPLDQLHAEKLFGAYFYDEVMHSTVHTLVAIAGSYPDWAIQKARVFKKAHPDVRVILLETERVEREGRKDLIALKEVDF